MRTALLVAVVLALVAAAAWALAGSRPASASYTVEVRDVAGVRASCEMSEVVVRANLMPEVIVCATAEPEVAGLPASGFEALN